MPQAIVEGQKYRFFKEGFLCQDWPDLIPYEDVLCAAVVPGSDFLDIDFKTPKGKKRRTTIFLERPGQEETLWALLAEQISVAAVTTRPQTVKETCGAWITFGICLDVLVGLIILMNVMNPATAVAPIWLIPFLIVGSFLSVGHLLTIGAVIFAVSVAGAAISLKNRKTVLEIKPNIQKGA